MESLIAFADEHGVGVRLHAGNAERPPARLVRFYQRFGFVEAGAYGEMVRPALGGAEARLSAGQGQRRDHAPNAAQMTALRTLADHADRYTGSPRMVGDAKTRIPTMKNLELLGLVTLTRTQGHQRVRHGQGRDLWSRMEKYTTYTASITPAGLQALLPREGGGSIFQVSQRQGASWIPVGTVPAASQADANVAARVRWPAGTLNVTESGAQKANDNAAVVIDLGNSESASIGVVPQRNGTYDAMTLTASKNFKTRTGAERWLASRGYAANGARLATKA